MEKVVVPQFVADYIENHYGGTIPTTWDRADLIRDWDNYINVSGNLKVKEWVKNESNFITFITAIITNDYEVEEKKYYWRKKKDHYLSIEYDEYPSYIHLALKEKIVFVSKSKTGVQGYKAKFTETEIRQMVNEADFNKLERVD